jgi:hypothetical protein
MLENIDAVSRDVQHEAQIFWRSLLPIEVESGAAEEYNEKP